MSIQPLRGPSVIGPAQAARRTATGGFSIAAETRGAAAATGVVEIGLDGLLSLQEVDPASERDRRARRHGEALLAALSRLQRAGLGDASGPEAAASLAALGRHAPMAADPRLRAVVEAISVRAHVELARLEMAHPGAGSPVPA